MKKFFEKHDLVKISCLVILFTIILTWIIPSGVFQSGTIDGSIQRTGFADLTLGGMMSVSFFLQQLVFVLFIGAFYGVMTRTEGYKKLVETLAKKLKGKEIYFIAISSLLIAVLTSLVTNIFAVLAFVPFVISVLLKMNLDKMTAFATTFGSMLIGVLGATYGTEGLISFVSYLKYYTTATLNVELAVRAGILVLAYVLFTFFTLTHAKKTLSDKKAKKEENVDLFVIEEAKKKNTKVWPLVLGFAIIFIILVLGFVNWSGNFEIKVFDTFHTWLTGLEVGGHAIFAYILGANAAAFGSWQLYHLILIMGLVMIISSFIYRLSSDDFIEGIYDGVKRMMKPIGVMLLVYVIFVLMYWSPIVPSIVNWVVSFVDGFNPFLSSIAASISAFFHVDFGYTGYAVGNLLATYEGDTFNIAFLIYTTMNGLISMFAPTSAVLMLGLSYLEIPYKKWFGYIWKFLVGMLICLLVIFALLTYL